MSLLIKEWRVVDTPFSQHPPNPLRHSFSALYQNHPKRCNVGDTLRALIFDEEGNEVNPADVGAEIQWFADGVEITDETDAEYTVLVGDVGVVLSVEVTIGDETYTAETEEVEAAAVEELKVTIVSDDEIPTVGELLTAVVTDEDGEVVDAALLHYQWYAGEDAIDESDTAILLVTDEFVGRTLSVKVTDAEGNTFESEPTAEVEAAEVEELTVSIDNTTPKVGDILTAEVVDRNGEDVSDNVTFQWYADGEAIEGADEETLVVDDELLGAALKVVVTAENGNVFESEETEPVAEEAELKVTIDNDEPTIGDILTATVEPEDAVVTYEWSVNGTVVATTATFEVPSSAKSGDRIKVVVTDADGEKAEDTVYVGGFSILKVEPTTATTGTAGYKYIRATFSNALRTLSEADIEIRDVKTEQLYSVEKVALSTDGYTADITIAGDASADGTQFLQGSTIYSCEINADGYEATLEFQLPDIKSDMVVTDVDMSANTITVTGSVRKGTNLWENGTTYNVGDTYAGNLGELVGHTVVIGVDADNNIQKLKVNDGDVVFGYLTAKDGDSDDVFSSSKDYFETVSGDKYYLSATETSQANPSVYVKADNSGTWRWITNGTVIDPKDTFEYGKLVLNPNGTVSSAVVWSAFDDHIFATTAEGSVAKETSNNSKDFKGYTVIEEGTLNYIDPADIADGDIIYYDTVAKLAFVYNDYVEGNLETVYEDKLVIDGEKYNFIVKNNNGVTVKNAEYYDLDNDTYELVTEKWANTIDKDEPVTIYLDTKGDIVLVDAEIGESVTHSKEYIITKSPKAYMNGLDQMMDMAVSDGTEVTLHIKASDITSINGHAFGDVTFDSTGAKTLADTTYVFNITDNDGKKTENVAGKDIPNHDTSGSDATVASTVFQQGGLIDVIYNDDETKVTGLKVKLGAQAAGIQMKQDDDSTEFKGGLTSIKTAAGALNLTGTTKVYVLTGTRLAADELQNDTGDDSDTGKMKEATDNKVKAYDYADFDLNTKAGDYKLKEIKTEEDHGTAAVKEEDTQDSAITVGSLVRFVADKTTAKAVIIDNRGFNVAISANTTHGDKKVAGTVGATGDIKGGQMFKDAETKTKILGVATNAEYQTNSDGVTMQLAGLTILTVEGSVTLDSFKDKLDTNQDIKNKIVVAELDADGKVQAITEGTNAAAAPAVDTVNYGAKVASSSTDTLTVTTTGGNVNVKADTNCLVVKFNGSSYSESSIGDINRDTDYTGIKFMTSQLNGTDVKATVIVATKSANTNSYTQAATTLVASATTLEIGETATITLYDQYGETMNQTAAATTSDNTKVDFTGTNTAGVNTVTVTAIAAGSSTITMQGKTITITVVAGS